MGDFGESQRTISKSIVCLCKKKGIFKAEEEEGEGVSAETIFDRLWYHEGTDSSLVRCQPVTGKTH